MSLSPHSLATHSNHTHSHLVNCLIKCRVSKTQPLAIGKLEGLDSPMVRETPKTRFSEVVACETDRETKM